MSHEETVGRLRRLGQEITANWEWGESFSLLFFSTIVN
jgi:hypothetical protein